MKEYYVSCSVCGIISGKIEGFTEACYCKNSHINIVHKGKGYNYLMIHDFKSNQDIITPSQKDFKQYN